MTKHTINVDQKLHFYFNWKLSLATLVFFPLLVYLGFWQLERAEEKRQIQSRWQQQQSLPPLQVTFFDHAMLEENEFRKVSVVGKFQTEKFWLLEGQVQNGELGYRVIMPFVLESDQIIAVDRGWIQGSPHRDYVPTVETPEGTITVLGSLTVPSDSKLVREAEVSVKAWPHKILEMDIEVMANQIEARLVLRILRLEPESQAAFVTNWRPFNSSVEKHIGYALQWFLLAMTLIILFVVTSSNISNWVKARFKKAEKQQE